MSVVIATRNGERYLGATMESIAQQTMTDWEMIVVDDGSGDGTAALVEARSLTDRRVRLISRPTSGGPYVAANDGMRAARGRFIARIDADDLAVSDRLERQIEFVTSEGLAACGAFHRSFRDGEAPGDIVSWVPTRPGALKWWLGVAGGPAHSTALFERRAIEAIGGYEELPAAADRWMWCDLARRGWVGVLPVPVILRRLHDAQLGTRSSEAQSSNSLAGAQYHLERLTGRPWAMRTVTDLCLVGHGQKVDVRRGLVALGRWWAAAERDRTLPADARQELRARSREILRRYLRGVVKNEWASPPGLEAAS